MPRKATEKTKPAAAKTKAKAQRNNSSGEKGRLTESDLQNITGGASRPGITYTRSSAQSVAAILDSELKATDSK